MTDTIAYATRRDRRRAASKNSAGLHAFAAGRTTAAVLAASGLVITTGVAANATEDSDEGRESATVQLNAAELNVERASQNEAVAVTASSDAELSFDRPVVSSEASPERVAAEEAADEQAERDAEAQAQAERDAEAQAEREAEAQAEAQQEQQQSQSEQAQPQQQSQPEQTQQQDQGTTTAGETAPEPEPEPEQPASSGGHSSVVGAAYGYVGIPWSQMDCSALVQNAYAQAGVSVPRDTYGQMTLPQVSSPAPGDIVISNGGAHAAIYIGNGQVISSTSSQGIRVHGLHESWHNVNSYHRPG